MTTKSITELVGELEDTLVAYDEADERSGAASRAKDQAASDELDAEMQRLGKVERRLLKKICSTPATSREEAVLQVIAASQLTLLVSEGSVAKKKSAMKVHDGLISALSRLIELPVHHIAATNVRRQYFDMPFKRARGIKPADLPALVAERNKIWHSNDDAPSDADSDKRSQNVCDQVNVLENCIADMVAPSADGTLAQFELLMDLVQLGGWSDDRDVRLIESIKAGLRKQTGDAK
jgi:hypothetical protein